MTLAGGLDAGGRSTWVGNMGDLVVDTAVLRSAVSKLREAKAFADEAAARGGRLRNVGPGVGPEVFPKEFGKAVLDWETWATDPARAAGHLLPDLLSAGHRRRRHRHPRGAGPAGGGEGRRYRSGDPEDRRPAGGRRGAGLARRRGRAEESGDSLKRKLGTELESRPGTDPVDAMSGIKDNIRYTMGFDEADYATRARDVAESLRTQGFDEVAFKNTWGSDGYQGINSNWRDPASGHVFELQFHTDSSFDAKSVSHDLCKEQRLPGTSPERAAELAHQQAEIFSRVPLPAGADALVGARPPVPAPTFDVHDGMAGLAGSHGTVTADRLADRSAGEGR